MIHKPPETAEQIIPRPRAVIPPTIEIIVVTPDERVPHVVFGLSERDYLSLAGWFSDILRFIEQQNAVLGAYEKRLSGQN